MEERGFYRQEGELEFRFRKLGTCYHLCTKENSPVIFHNENEFITAMNVVGYVSLLFPDIRILTFEIMSNHFHFVLCGDKEMIMKWFRKLLARMKSHPGLSESKEALAQLELSLIEVESLTNLRNVIAYVNRNGFVVSPHHTPFTYPWGANIYYFNPEAKLRFELLGKHPTFRERRTLFRSNSADHMNGLKVLNGYVNPLCFCKISEGEELFMNARSYFSKIAKSVESSAEIAKSIGESLFYTDDELYLIVSRICIREYGEKSPVTLTADAKIELAKKLHFSYNSSNKQISRILRMDMSVVDALFSSFRHSPKAE